MLQQLWIRLNFHSYSIFQYNLITTTQKIFKLCPIFVILLDAFVVETKIEIYTIPIRVVVAIYSLELFLIF